MNADMMVFPTGYEGFGLPVAEAASFGVAPLASDISMLDELLPHGVNRLPLDAPDAWAAIINEFAADSQARQNAVDAVRAHISAHDLGSDSPSVVGPVPVVTTVAVDRRNARLSAGNLRRGSLIGP